MAVGRFRIWRSSAAAGVALLAITGASFAGALVSSVEPDAWLSPPGAEVGKTLDSAEPFEITLHLQAESDTVYDLGVSYEGDNIGTCQEDTAALATNPQGKAVWTCELNTATNEDEEELAGIVRFVVSLDAEEVASVDALLSVRPAEDEEAEETQAESDESDGPENHGQCVARWAVAAKEAGLHGKWYGGFVSTVAQEGDAVAVKGAEDPGEACDFSDELEQALADQDEAEAAEAEARADRDEGKAAKAAEREARKAAKGNDAPGEEGPDED